MDSKGIQSITLKKYKDITPSERYNQIARDIEFVAPFFVEKNIRASRNIDYYMNSQWNRKELAYFRRQNRIPYVFNKVYSIINNIIGSYEQVKSDVKAVPVGVEDEYLSLVLNKLLKWWESINKIDIVERNVFKSGLLCGVGCTQIRWSQYDVLGGYPLLEYVPNDQLFWDTGSILPDMSDCRWMTRMMPMSKADALELMPEFEEQIEKNSVNTSSTPIPYVRAYIDAISKFGRYYDIAWRPYVNELRSYQWVIEHYERVCAYQYIVCDHIYGNEPAIFDTIEEANKYKDAILDKAMHDALPIIDENGEDYVYTIKMKKDLFLQTIIFNNEVLSFDIVDIPSFPFQLYFPIYVDGEFIAPADTLLPAQKFVNRMLSEWDNILIRGPKGLITVIESKLAQGWSFQDVVENSNRAGIHIPVHSHDAIQQHSPTKVSPDFANLFSIAQQYMIDSAGGQNIFGLQENAAESGRAVRARQAAAGLLRLPYFRNLEIWRTLVSEYALWMMRNYMSPKYMERIINMPIEVKGQEFVNNLRDYRTDIVIDTAVDSQITRESALESFKEFFQAMQGQIPPELVISILLELDPNIPIDIKEKIMSQLPIFAKQAEINQQDSETQKIVSSVVDAMQRKEIAELANTIKSMQSGEPSMNGQQNVNGEMQGA